MFNTTRNKFPIHIEIINPQNNPGLLEITCGPGCIPWMIKVAMINDITGVVGIPILSAGMKLVCAAALFALSGPATPSIAPFPNFSGFLESLFSRA